MLNEVTGLISNNFEITQNKLVLWRGRYTKAEYPGKVALNLHYVKAKGDAYFPLVAASYGINHYIQNGQQEYVHLKQVFLNSLDPFNLSDAGIFIAGYNAIRTWEKTAEQRVIPILESQISQMLRQGDQQIVTIQSLVDRSNAGDRSALRQLERSYTDEVMAFEVFLIWSAWGLANKEPQDAVPYAIGVTNRLPSQINSYSDLRIFFKQTFVNSYVDDHFVALPPL